MWLFQFLAYWRPITAIDEDEGLTTRLAARAPATALETSSNVAVLRRSAYRPASSIALEAHLVSNTSTELQTIGGGAGYGADVLIDDTPVLLSVDTGSSDTWLVSTDLQCVSPRGTTVPRAYCNFGPSFEGKLTGGTIPNQNFNVSYGSGEFVAGTLGYTNLTIADVTISRQEVGLVKKAYWRGDNESTGLMGLGYRSLTSSYQGDDPSNDSPRTNIGYSPVIESGMSQGLFSMFSLALQRGKDDVWGYLAFGGLPPVEIDQIFVSTPILLTNLTTIGRSESVYSFYAVRPDGFTIAGGLLAVFGIRFATFFKSTSAVIIDSGTTLNYLPVDIAVRINSLFNPPAQYNPYVGAYEVECSAKAPDMAVRIGGVDFPINPVDLIIQTEGGYDPDTRKCLTTIQPSGRNTYILGDVFLKNVVAVFDVGAAQIRFASRPYY